MNSLSMISRTLSIINLKQQKLRIFINDIINIEKIRARSQQGLEQRLIIILPNFKKILNKD